MNSFSLISTEHLRLNHQRERKNGLSRSSCHVLLARRGSVRRIAEHPVYISDTYICPRRYKCISIRLIRCQENSLPRPHSYLKSSFRSYFLAANISALLPALRRKALPWHMKHPRIFRANNPWSHGTRILVNPGPNVIFGLLLRFPRA